MPAGFKSNVKTKRAKTIFKPSSLHLKTIAHLELLVTIEIWVERGWEELLIRYQDGAVAVLLFIRVPQTFCL